MSATTCLRRSARPVDALPKRLALRPTSWLGLALLAAGLQDLAPALAAERPRNLIVQPVAAATAPSAQRLALVIGNSAYKDAPLSNPVNDAKAMAQALREAGFTVLLHTDTDHRGMLAALRDFGARLRQGGVGVFYFAGHGMQIKGRNYLIPVGADIQREDEVAYAALDAQAVLDKMETAGNGANLMILDACRNNPFARSFRSSVQGLAQMEAPVGTLVAFATAPGTVASDGKGGNGLYTQHLLRAMRQPGAKVEDVFKRVRAAVRRDSEGKQIPWEATSLEGDLYFLDPPKPPPAPPPPPPATAVSEATLDDTFWQAVRDSREPAVLQGYLNRYPQGRHADDARRRLLALAPRPQPVPAPAAAPSPAPLPAPSPAPLAVAPAPAPTPTPPSGSATAVVQQLQAMGGASDRQRPQAEREAIERLAASGGRTATGTLSAAAVIQQLQSMGGRLPASPSPPPAGAAPSTTAAPAAAAAAVASLVRPGAVVVGDRWNFQNIDRWRGEVTENFTWRVAGNDPQGAPLLAGDTGYVDPISQVARKLVLPAAWGQTAAPDAAVWWGGRPGEVRQVTVTVPRKRGDGQTVQAQMLISLKSARTKEAVKVPAGEFEAVRVDGEGEVQFESTSGAVVVQHWKLRAWYVPELRGLVALETEVREAGGSRLESTRRAELTNFALATPRLAAGR